MAKRRAPHRGVLITVLVVLGVGAGVAAWWQSDTVLLCQGTVRGGQQTNPKDEQMSLVVTINLYRSTMKIDEGSAWPLTGDTSRNVLVATAPDGSATINRMGPFRYVGSSMVLKCLKASVPGHSRDYSKAC